SFAADRHDDGDLTANEIGRQRRHPVILALSPAILDCDVSALDKASFLQAAAEASHQMRERTGRRCAEKSHYRHRRLLRSRRERPPRRATEQRDELAPVHSITSSTSASSLGGTVRASALAVWRLIINSNLVACSTGRSAGLAPLRIRAAYAPALRYASVRLGP